MDNEITVGRRVKRRAARACSSCRCRKVRCNVVESGPPCTNCRLDSVECVIVRNKRHRVSRSHVQTASSMEKLPTTNLGYSGHDWLQNTLSDGQFSTQNLDGEISRTSNGHALRGQAPLTTPATSVASFEHNGLDWSQFILSGGQSSPQNLRQKPSGTINGPSEQAVPTTSTISSESSQYFYGRSHFDCAPTTQASAENDIITIPHLPPYITPLPNHLDKTTLQFLSSNGALSLPSAEFRHICASRYLELLHPLFPLLDLHNLLAITQRGNNDCGTISLLLFNAVFCAALAFVESEHVIRAGYSSKRAARMAFFKRAKLLYDLDTEPDRFISIQAALLLSNWYPGLDDKKDPWFWSGTAISLGHAIGLHLDPAESKVGNNKKKIWRRLWWTSFCREQKLALGFGRPSRLTYYNVPMLTLDDFCIGSLPDGASYLECTMAGDIARQEQLARLCIEHTKLCICICHIVSSIFANRRSIDSDPQDIYNGVYNQGPSEDIDKCARQAERWLANMPKDLMYETVSKEKYNIEDRCLIMAKANIHIVYYGAIGVLFGHRSLSSSLSWDYCDEQGQHRTSRHIVRDAAVEITRVNQDLHKLGLLPYSSSSAVGTIVTAAMVHLLDVKLAKSTPRAVEPDKIQQGMEFLHILQEAYGSAVNALHFLRLAARSAGIPISEPETKDRGPMDTPPQEEDIAKMFQAIPISTRPAVLSESPPSWGMGDELFSQSCLTGPQDVDFFGDIFMLDYDGASEFDRTAGISPVDMSFGI